MDEDAFNNHHDQPYYQQWLADNRPDARRALPDAPIDTFPDDASWRHLRMAVAGSEDPASWT